MTELAITVHDDGTTDERPLVFEVGAKGGFSTHVEPPTQRPALPRPLTNRKQEAYDEMRRPQAVVLFRALKANSMLGLSWKECWALGEGNGAWDVGPIVVWLRAHGVSVDARYDSVVGETRFYIG